MSYFYSQPSRDPAWKWQRVLGIVRDDQPEADDVLDSKEGAAWIRRALAFYRSFRREENPLRNHELISQFGDIFTAYEFYRDHGTYMRSEIEASVLARATPEEIAMSCACTAAAIRAYEALFFDVRERLDSRGYIEHHVIGTDIQNLTKDKLDTIWKLFAYNLGYQVLRALISRTTNPQTCMTQDTVRAGLQEDIMGSFALACAIAAKHPDGGDEGQKHLLALNARFAEISKQEDKSAGGASLVAEHIEAMLEQLPFAKNGIVIRGKQEVVTAAFTTGAVDPSLAELTELALTGTSTTFEMRAGAMFPSPPRKGKK